MRLKLLVTIGLILGLLMIMLMKVFAQEYNMTTNTLSTTGYSKPARGSSFVYTLTGTTYTRVSDVGTDVSGRTIMRTMYSRYPAKNADGTMIYLETDGASGGRNGCIYSATNYALISNIPTSVVIDGSAMTFPSMEGNEFRWDPVRPTIMYCVQGYSGYGGKKFIEYDVIKSTGHLIRDFAYNWPSGHYLNNNTEGNCSDDARYWAWTLYTDPGSGTHIATAVIVYDKTLDVIVGTMTYTTYQALGGQRASLPTPNMVDMSPLGNKVIFDNVRAWDDRPWVPGSDLYKDIGTCFDGAYAFDRNFTNPVKVAVDATHSGWAWDNNGNEMFVSQNNRSDYLEAVNIQTGALTQFKYHLDLGTWYTNFHFARMPQSCRNWILLSTYGTEAAWAQNQMFMLKISSMNAGTWRIGPTFNTYSDYQNESFTPIDRTGTKIQTNAVWTSGNQDSYDIALPPDWMYVLNGSTYAAADATAPTTSNKSPSSGATNVSKTTSISVSVNDSGSGVNSSSTTLTINSVKVYDGHTPASYPNVTVTGSAASYTLTYSTTTAFAFGSTVTVAVTSQDLTAPPNVMNTDTYTFAIEETPGGSPGGRGYSIQ
jgi:hypothetical protein